MKTFNIVQLVYFCIASISCSFSCFGNKKDEINKSESVFNDLEYKITKKFIKDSIETSCFSPICCLSNIYQMCCGKEFEKDNVSETGEKMLLNVTKGINDKDKIFSLVNCLYKKDSGIGEKTFTSNTNYSHLNIKIYKECNAKDAYDEHLQWFEKITFEKINSPIKISDFTKYDRIYLTVAMFKADWAKIFDERISQTLAFYNSFNVTEQRMFLTDEENYKNAKVEINNVSFHLVALPYASDKIVKNERYMVYLIPLDKKKNDTDPNANLSLLWSKFYKNYSKNNIGKVIKDLNKTKIRLYIPKISDLKSEFDMLKYIGDITKHSKALKITSKMRTCLNIDEYGTKAMAAMATRYFESFSKDSSNTVIANVSHISFIFDMKLEKILFITKYLGFSKVIK